MKDFECAVETDNLVKQFKGHTAVKGVSIKVPKGSVYGFLGPNGAGKTTTLKMLNGLTKPTSGTIRICGREVVFGSCNSGANTGFLPDVPNYYEWMTAPEFMKLSGEIFGLDRDVIKSRTFKLLDLVGLSGVNKRVGGYSRGMKQRLGIAQALINEPEVVFLDEPTSALDPIGRKEVLDIIKLLSGKTTVFFSTHILSDIERVCDRVSILDMGQIILEDTISGLKEKYGLHAIELETDEERKEAIKDVLTNAKWVEKLYEKGNGSYLIHVRDMKKAQYQIPCILRDNNLPIKKFNMVEPSLEDIFLKVVKSNEASELLQERN